MCTEGITVSFAATIQSGFASNADTTYERYNVQATRNIFSTWR